MGSLPTPAGGVDLRAVTVRPTWGAEEHRRWDRMVAAHHYLPFHGVFGKGLRHVATVGPSWLALIGWQPGAFKLAARDHWIGWSAQQQFRRLHLIANNARFVILTPRPVPNLASRVLGLSLRRLSQDMQAVHGYPILLAETFVDPARFAGTCYRASNWRSLGLTRGYAREPGGTARWRHHGQPKEVFVFELSSGFDLTGRIVTLDAMHAQHDTARCLLGRRADYVLSAIKDNQQTIFEDLAAIDWSDAPWHETVDKGHGRIERRRCAVVDLCGAEWNGYADLYGRRQAMRIERERETLKTGKRSIEVTYSLTSLSAERAGPKALLGLVRNHWHIENRLHYVRDFTYDEDRCRAYVRHLPRNLACLTNAAIAIVRCNARFRYLPEANRHYAARAQEALDTILNTPTA